MATTVPTERNMRSDDLPSRTRPKVLFLAYYFPPLNASGCVRTWNIAMYLTRLGWDMTVITPDPSMWRKVEDCEKVLMELDGEGIKRILTDHQWRCLVPDYFKCWDKGLGWVAGGICRSIARNLKIDYHIGWISAAGKACSGLNPKDVTSSLRPAHHFWRLG